METRKKNKIKEMGLDVCFDKYYKYNILTDEIIEYIWNGTDFVRKNENDKNGKTSYNK